MLIRELYFKNFRSFRGERRISFADPNNNEVRPLTVLAGSNGSGKTTVIESIEAMLQFIRNPEKRDSLLHEALHSSLISMTIEFTKDDLEWVNGEKARLSEELTGRSIQIVIGNSAVDPSYVESLNDHAVGVIRDERKETVLGGWGNQFVEGLRHRINASEEAEDGLRGGYLFFPYNRQIGKLRKGVIEPPKSNFDWVFQYTAPNRWQGSLEQLWVWQNYLDLEKKSEKRENLTRFVDSVERVLGEKRQITIEEGRVLIPVGYSVEGQETPKVSIDQLPSGEQQVLLLFGELARLRRQGAVIAIDEVENSLHPTMQRLVMWNLRRLAKEWNSQIIVATHSIEVINAVRGGAFINLDYPESHFNVPVADEDPQE